GSVSRRTTPQSAPSCSRRKSESPRAGPSDVAVQSLAWSPFLSTNSGPITARCSPAVQFGRALHNGDSFRGQAVERIHQLVYLPLQSAPIRLGIALLRWNERQLAVVHKP